MIADVIRLRVLDEVTWDGAPVPGERTHALLRGLVEAGGRGLSDAALVDEVWVDGAPANPTKALQVVVSRARAATSPRAIERTARGYRLTLAAEEVDAWAVRPEGLRLAAAGRYAEALPLLERAGSDDEVVAALLHSVAAVRGVPAALERYEAYRTDLADRLGVDPAPALRALHADLLARDRPVRVGLLYDASSLVGRDADVAALGETIRGSRIASIVGPGGLGKTRLAHLMGRLAEETTVHFVELAGVASPEDVAVEVAGVLGVRESVADRWTSAAARRTDLVGRIVDQVGTAPALLILDNCEHLVEAVADLVSGLVQRTPSLRVLTTTRAPLDLAAERVYRLPQLSLDDAVALFVERATAARPGVLLDESEVRTLVARLDGLPLAVELAAAKVRVMSVAEIGRRLEDRFALLRGGARDAPERHQTLLAVIDWSWNLLGPPERAALRRLSVFRDGFSLAGAEAVVAGDALGPLAVLVDQSLVTVQEDAGVVRYRLLETVREFGRLRLAEAGDDGPTVGRLRDWAIETALRASEALFGAGQVDAMAAIRMEEGNLLDALRRALRARDRRAVVAVMACLSDFWTIEGSHLKVVGLAHEVEDVVAHGPAPEGLVEQLRTTLTAIAFNSMIFSDVLAGDAMSRLEEPGTGTGETRSEASAKVLLAARAGMSGADPDALERLCGHPVRQVRQAAYLWSSLVHENAGEIDRALELATRSRELTDGEHGPWPRAMVDAQLAGLAMQVGAVEDAVRHAAAALPGMEALGAVEDVAQLKAVLALAAIREGRYDEAGRVFDEIEESDTGSGVFGAALILLCGRSELALVAGRVDEGLEGYRAAVRTLANRRIPGVGEPPDQEPWVLYAEAAALSAHTRRGRHDEARGLRDDAHARALRALAPEQQLVDYPLVGSVVLALAQWDLFDDRATTEARRRAARLIVLAESLGYNRYLPSLSWEPAAERAESVVPGVLARVRSEIAGRRAVELRDQVRDLVAELDDPA